MSACLTCAAANPDGAAFCEACGKPLSAVEATTSNSAKVGPGSITPPVEYLPGEAPSTQVSTTASPQPTNASTEPPSPKGPAKPCTSCGGVVEDTYCTVCGVLQPSERDHFEESPAGWVAGVCDKGIVHARNEDAMATAVESDVALLVVCDGVTTAPLSERASLAAARAACDLLVASVGASSWEEAIKASCIAAQAEAVAVARTLGDPPEPPSCTFCVAVVDREARRVAVGWCGDSRAYWLPDAGDGLILSIDDSIASQMIAAGTSRAAAEADHRAHTITRWLGADSPDPTALTASFPLTGAGWVLVVSDGLWNYASEPKDIRALITAISENGVVPTPLEVTTELVRFANSQGGVDNITVAAARIEES